MTFIFKELFKTATHLGRVKAYLIKLFKAFLEISFRIRCKFLGGLIDRIVSQVYEEIRAAFISLRGCVLFSCESTKSISINECCYVWLNLGNKYIDPQVKLPSIYEVRGKLILLHNVALVSRDVFSSPCQEYPFALALVLRLNYQSCTLSKRPAL